MNDVIMLVGMSLFASLLLSFALTAAARMGATKKDTAPPVPSSEHEFPPLAKKKAPTREETELLSSDDMITSSEIDLLEQEDVSQLETQPIPTEKKSPSAKTPKAPSPEDFNLEDIVKRLRAQMFTPLDYEFPERMAVLDMVKRECVMVTLVNQRSPETEVDLATLDFNKEPVEVMRWIPKGSRCECHLLVRPFIRLLWPKEEWGIDQLRSMRGTVEISGNVIAEDVPIDSWVVNFDGKGLTALPYQFVPSQSAFLWGHRLDYEAFQEACGASYGYPRSDGQEVQEALAPVVTNEDDVIIKLSKPSVPTLRFVVGCVTAVYSTVPR